ncbi:MAG TPA: hypothetical protein VMU80_09745 [Bryobacteraceae bacterium]|nr:hypothetical protein [Bryobacteraceae bacterium]
MLSSKVWRSSVFGLLIAGVGGLSAAKAAAPNVTFTASGTFASPVSGTDELRLAGEPFSITIVASSASNPIQHGSNWAVLSPFKMTGTVHSGLLSTTPVTISSAGASIQQAIGPTYDLFIAAFPIKVVGLSLTIKANVTMPPGTLSTLLIHPFSAVALAPGNATVTYSDSSGTTTLAVAKGSLTATSSTSPTASAKVLAVHSQGGEIVTLHEDGTQSVRPFGSGLITVGTEDKVVLRLYASGVADASTVQAEIGGEQVPILYTGKSGYFAGLDEIHVLVPSSLAARGSAELVITVNGQVAKAVPIQIQ